MSKESQICLAFDIGGTKIAAGVVTSTGRILIDEKVAVNTQAGPAAFLTQLVKIGSKYLRMYPEIKKIGIASAGPLDPDNGILLDPTNFSKGQKSWGKVDITAVLSVKLKRQVILENDAAAALLAESWLGLARKMNNATILTLGTGLGTSFICNGILIRSGRGLHTEGGHMILNPSDKTAVCGCLNIGCAEAYLSGGGFTKRARLFLNNQNISTIEVANQARNGDKKCKLFFDEYARYMATAIHNFSLIFSSEIFILTGSFAATSDLFLPKTKKYLKLLLTRRRKGIDLLPKIAVSRLNNKAGLLGGAYVAFNDSKRLST